MLRIIRSILYVGVISFIIGRVVYLHLTDDRGLPATEGIRNFGKIDEHLYRGAQLDAAGIARLKQLGVAMIINLRGRTEKDGAITRGKEMRRNPRQPARSANLKNGLTRVDYCVIIDPAVYKHA